MTERRIQFNKVVNSQLPSYVREEFPLISEFLSQYYISQEFKGSSLDLIQNIDKYIKIDENSKNKKTLRLSENISATDTTISVSFLSDSLSGTKGFPDSYGLIQIGDEIITYTSKTNSSFVGCIRGFSGISEYSDEELIFSKTNATSHSQNDEIINLSDLFLSEFLRKIKNQFLPGFEQRDLYEDVNQNIFIKQSKDFYSVRGTDESFKILFKVLYGEDVKVIRPKEYLFRPSDAHFNKSKDLVIEPISGNPLNLKFSTLYQDQYGSIERAYGPISKVEKLYSDSGDYYRISLDSGYNRDLVDDGSIYGAFTVHPKTKCIGQVSPGSETIDVDSTVGFESFGELYLKFSNGNVGIVSYTSKSLNQFYGCTNITDTINDGENISINTYAYARSFENQDDIIKVRINSILNSFENLDQTYGLEKEDLIQIRTLGVNPKDFRSNNWLINAPTSYQVQSISQTNSLPITYRVITKNNHTLNVGDFVRFTSSSGDNGTVGTVIELNGVKSFTISDINGLDLSRSYTITRILLKSLDNIISNVQNVYKIGEDTLVSSPSLPYFPETTLNTSNKTISFSVPSSFFAEEIQVTSSTDHGFYTGDSIYYTPASSTETTIDFEGIESTVTTIISLFPNLPNNGRGRYYVKRVNANTIKLSTSKSNLYNNIFLSASSDNGNLIHRIQKYEFYNKSIQNQKILREIKSPINNGYQYETLPGTTGILVNGVEILNYKSKDSVFYGNLESIDVLGGGSNYDVINPLRVEITDNVGFGATGYCSIEGSLSSIQIVDPGFDYTELPTITITGGNGSGAIARPNMSLVNHNAYFNSNSDISLSTSVIGFTTYHRFRNNESVVYKTDNQIAVGGLSTDANYFVSTRSLYDLTLHRTYEDSVAGINTISFTSLGEGRHYLSSTNKKSIISSINIENPGVGYENKKRTVFSSGINTSSNTIFIKNHDFQSGETVKYTSSGTIIGGLTNNQNYIVSRVDADRFKLSEVGIGQTGQNFFYQNRQYLNLTSSGSGIHIFNYPEISVNISGSTGIASTISSAIVQPIFRGSVTSIHLEDGGVGYGSSEVLNFNRPPNIFLTGGRSAQATPIISNGSIVEVIIDNRGEDYLSVPDLRILSDTGNGAVLTPVIENGQLISVVVIEGGSGYIQGETLLEFSNPGNGVDFDIQIKEWKINLFEKEYSTIQNDDGFVSESINSSYELAYVNLYAPRKLRKLLNAINSDGDKIYGQSDLVIRNNLEINSTNHSPIIGWAYDGNPIYGPYGYSRKSGGSEIARMKSGYSLVSNRVIQNRPPTSIFPNGFFIDDYEYIKSSDESVLDENNGRYCVTPDFPNGTYAYFATISESTGTGIFLGFKEPQFPYLIGNKFKSRPNHFNFEASSNQDDFDINQTNWARNTTPYNLKNTIPYNYIQSSKNLNQKSKIKSVSIGSVEDVEIISRGNNYKVNDSLIFDEQNSDGFGANAKVSFVGGKTVNNISVATSSINEIEIYPTLNVGEFVALSRDPHNLSNNDIVYISGLSTTSYVRTQFYRVGVRSESFSLSREISNTSSTGLVTSIYLSGNLLSLKENDILGIGTETVKVLNVYPNESRIRCIRSVNGIGVSHSSTELVRTNPRNFNFNIGIRTSYPFKINRELYFYPQESVGLGTTSTTSTLFFNSIPNLSPIGIGTSTQSIIYFRNSRDYFRYNSGGYVDIVNSTSIGFNTENARIVSVGETTITIDFDTSTLSGSGVTAYLNRRNAIDIPTGTIYIPNHTLETGDLVTYYSNSGNSLSVTIAGIGSTTISDGSNLYVAKVSNDLIGLSTVRVGLGTTGTFVGITSETSTYGLLRFVGLGTGVYHSLLTNYDKLTGNISRNIVNVSTSQTHGLNVGDIVDISVNPSISTTFIVRYNDYNKRLILNPKDFTSVGVNTISNTITILSHGFKTGQKVIHTSSSPSGGLEDNKIYYVVVIDENNLKLSSNYFDTQSNIPQVIGITSSSLGTLSGVNPLIKGYKNSSVIFDLSDSSLSFSNGPTIYSAFDFELFSDNNFTNLFDSTGATNDFEVIRQGRVGIDTNARVTVNINKDFPNVLYYKLTPVGNTDNISIPEDKLNIVLDEEVDSNNQLQVSFSLYNGRYPIVSSSTTSFSYQISNSPEALSYVSTSSSITYKTSSLTAYGPIENIKVNNSGSNYSKIPDILYVESGIGTGANLKVISNSIGKIRKTNIFDFGTDFSSDRSLRPSVILPQLIQINSLSTIEFIGITSFGRGYTSTPSLLLFDGLTGQLVSDVDLRYGVGDRNVTILKNTRSLSNIPPTILPVQNSNGVGISSVSFNNSTKDVTVTLSVGFSTAGSFPFSVNDRVLIENIGVTTGRGYNSIDYNYQLFTVTAVDPNIGGYGTVTYNINNLLSDGETPGTFDPETSSGRIIAERDFPIFNISLRPGEFFEDEIVTTSSNTGIVQKWDNRNNILKVSSKDYFEVGDVIVGSSSKTVGIASSITYFNTFYNTSYFNINEYGWSDDTGKLNNNLQVIQDGDYYQNFSYSLSSRVDLETWDEVVSTLNHTAGFKKFSEYIIESKSDNLSSVSESSFEVINDLISESSLYCYNDFDFVSENAIQNESGYFSDEIIFENRILQDYFESVGNRVLSIDNISTQFNSNPRPTNFSEVDRFDLDLGRFNKYVSYIRDRRYTSQRQLMLITLIHSGGFGYINQYGRVETVYDLGSFDFSIDGSEGILLYYPTNSSINDYDITTLSYRLEDGISGIGTTTIGSISLVETDSISVSSGQTTIVGISTAYRSAKILVGINVDDSLYEFDEISVIHDGTNVEQIEYGQLTSNSNSEESSIVGYGTYYSYISGSQLNIDFIPEVGIGTTIKVNALYVAFADESISGSGSTTLNHAKIISNTTAISSTSSPTQTGIVSFKSSKVDDIDTDTVYQAAYHIVQVTDTTNNRYQLSEVLTMDFDQTETTIVEFGNIETSSGLGTIGAYVSANYTYLTFTPLPNIDVDVKVYTNALRYDLSENGNGDDAIDFTNASVETQHGTYTGTDSDIRRSFELKHNGFNIFERIFDGSSSSIVSISEDTINIPNHFFVTGENITYTNAGGGSTTSIGIALTDFGVGIGTTDRIPSSVYVIKVNDNAIKLARNAEEALLSTPISLDITSVGIGTNHTFTSTKQNSKVIIAIDNLIQSPVVSTALTTTLALQLGTSDDIAYFSGITSFFSGDLIKIGNEIMKIESVGVGSTNSVRIRRPWLGTEVVEHSIGSLITKIIGNYNIVNNTLNFVEAPYGNLPYSSVTNPPDERDWLGISTSSTFQGRSFLRSGLTNTTNETYYKNYVFDDISEQFDGENDEFTLNSSGLSVTGIENENAIILINDIFQGPGQDLNYTLSETSGITSISFVGTGISASYDVNTSSLPRGGVIVSVGSDEGFGYQPLVAAGGTAVVSVAGTIQSISIGNSGSGYRSGSQVVRVGVGYTTTFSASIEFIGTATVSNGNIVSVAITNPGTGYTSSNPPFVVFDEPLSYSNIPLVYSPSSSGIGTAATIDIVVGQGSSVIDFQIKNTGYGYGQGEILTIPIGGLTGIPTTSSYSEFQISIQRTTRDKFTGWSLGELQLIDNIENLFNNSRISFPIRVSGNLISIRSSRGSVINVQDTLLIFVNDILQVPGEGYQFTGGSFIRFTEPPKVGDTCKIFFYRGTGSIDVIERDILETVKIGDELTISYDPTIGQSSLLQEDARTVTSVNSTDSVNTNPYFGPGNVSNSNLLRPVIWCKQTEDKIINQIEVGKDRVLYEPAINPSAYLISPIGIGSTILYVDNVRPFFAPYNESSASLAFQNNVTIIPQDNKVVAVATAIVSTAGTVSSIVLSDGGSGYTTNPSITLESPVGLGTTQRATSTSSISAGIVTSISVNYGGIGYTFTNPPQVLIEPPAISLESNTVNSYEGDSGIIIGISTTSVGIASTAIVFDLFIPQNSYLRDASITGSAVTAISGISTGDYFVIYNSNVGYGATILSESGSVVGIATTYLDGVYKSVSVSIVQTSVSGVGITDIARVVVSVSDYNGLNIVGIANTTFIGEYSWGKVNLSQRTKNNTYEAYVLNGYLGIATGTIVNRTNKLKFLNYT